MDCAPDRSLDCRGQVLESARCLHVTVCIVGRRSHALSDFWWVLQLANFSGIGNWRYSCCLYFLQERQTLFIHSCVAWKKKIWCNKVLNNHFPFLLKRKLWENIFFQHSAFDFIRIKCLLTIHCVLLISTHSLYFHGFLKILSTMMLLFVLTTLAILQSVAAGPLVVALCYSACNAGVVSCYSAAGLVFGTNPVGWVAWLAGGPAAASACSAAQGACMAACTVSVAAPTLWKVRFCAISQLAKFWFETHACFFVCFLL